MTGTASSRPTDFPVFSPADRSLLKKHLTRETWEALKGLETRRGTTLFDCIRSGLAHADSRVGLYAGDEESYEVFGRLFAPVIEDCHRAFRTSTGHHDAVAQPDFVPALPDPEGKYIVSTRIRICRNLRGYGLVPTIGRSDLLEVERKARQAFSRFSGPLEGRYRSLNDLGNGEMQTLREQNLLFGGDDRFQSAAGIRRFWPDGRGLFLNASRSLMVWVNEEDHLRVISMQENADLAEVYSRLSMAMRVLDANLEFQHSDRYGYIASCPTNLDTGMRASFHIRLPLSGAGREFGMICDRCDLQVRGASGERTQTGEGLYDISNRRRLGLSEVQILQGLIEGARQLIDLEKSMESGKHPADRRSPRD
jgi:protein-arginine kinase